MTVKAGDYQTLQYCLVTFPPKVMGATKSATSKSHHTQQKSPLQNGLTPFNIKYSVENTYRQPDIEFLKITKT